MMKCTNCKESAVFLHPGLCRKHFLSYFERKVKKTISEFGLIKKTDKIVVACSGGKDSTTVLYLLHKFHGNVTALAIDEGIHGYRDKTLVDLHEFCTQHKIPLKIVSFKDQYGKTLDTLLKTKEHPCTVCGSLRRNLMNGYSQDYDKIATGHNLDDESQAIMMNLLKNQTFLLKSLGPITEKKVQFTQRIKPLYWCTEKEVMTYAVLMHFKIGFVECPYVHDSYRNEVRDLLNAYEAEHPGTKENVVKWFLRIKPKLIVQIKEKNMEKFQELFQ